MVSGGGRGGSGGVSGGGVSKIFCTSAGRCSAFR